MEFLTVAIVLFFTRLIGEELFDEIPCVNLHPALLPAFPGFDAIAGLAGHQSFPVVYGSLRPLDCLRTVRLYRRKDDLGEFQS